MSVLANDKLIVRLITVNRIGYGSKVISPTRSKGKSQSRYFKIILILRRFSEVRRSYLMKCGLIRDVLHVAG
jgi:hypothetical protein